MPTQPFFASTNGDPASMKRMFAFQTLDTVPCLDAALVPYKSYGGRLTPKPTSIERHAVLTRPMKGRRMKSKIDNDGLLLNLGDADASNAMQLGGFLSLLQGYSLATADGHTRWRISQQQAIAGTAMYKKFTHVGDANIGIPVRYHDVIASSLEFGVSPRTNADMKLGVQAGHFDHWGVPTRTTGTGVVLPFLRGTTSSAAASMTGNWAADATDKDVFITIISDSATEVVFQAKEATAGSYSASQTATKGEWCYVYVGASATVPLGGRAGQVEVYFPTGANNTFVDADVFEFTKRRVVTILDADYPTPRPMAETQYRFNLNGHAIYVDNGVVINVDVPGAETRYVAGGEQSIGTNRVGQHVVTVTLDRDLVDLDLQQALMTGAEVSLVADGRNDTVVGTSTNYWGIWHVFPSLDVEGSMHDADEGATNNNEVLTLYAHPPESNFSYGGITDFAADYEVVFDTDLVAADLNL